MIAAVVIGLVGGAALGLCAAPLWMMLQLPARVSDIFESSTDMRIYALALAIGSTLGTLRGNGALPDACAVTTMALGGVFVGMLASALTEALEVIPTLFDRLSVTADMRYAAAAMAIGKAAGAVLAGLMGA